MAPETWLTEREIEHLPPARGAADPDFESSALSGWILLPDRALTHVEVHLNGAPLAFAPLQDRPDVAALYRRHPHAVRSGYQLAVPVGRLRVDDINRVTTVGYFDGRPRGRHRRIAFDPSLAPDVPIPPMDLLKRTQGDNTDRSIYKLRGYRFYREVLDAIKPHRDPWSIKRVLDWGCGTGRVTANFLLDAHHYVVHACDPHPASIDWCQGNLAGGRFTVSPWDPPLEYPRSHFDLIFALGVVYYFDQAQFSAWLRELRRLSAARALLVLSIQGAVAAAVRLPRDAFRSFTQNGFINLDEYDVQHPPAPDDQLHRGGCYWTPNFVKQTALPHFRVLEYLEGAFNGDQDLIVFEPV